MSYTKGIDNKDLGMPTKNRPVTTTLYVSPDGVNSNGSSWARAYTNIPDALDAASTDPNCTTLILIGATSTYYDMNKAGDPTWAANVELLAPHRIWAPIKNTNVGATSILKLTGKSSVENLVFFQEADESGLIMTNSGFRIRKCGFNSENSTTINNSIYINGTAGVITGGIIENVKYVGNVSYTTACRLNNITECNIYKNHIHECGAGYTLDGALTSNNIFDTIDIGKCTIGIDIGVCEGAHFRNMYFHDNDDNVLDSTASPDTVWANINGQFPIFVEPEDLNGQLIESDVNSWGNPVLLRNSATKPFKVISYSLEPSEEETMIIRLSTEEDELSSVFVESVFASKKDKASGSGDASDYIFNTGEEIWGRLWGSDSSRNVRIWLNIQEI